MPQIKRNKVELIKKEKDGFDVLQDLLKYSQEGDFDAIEKADREQRFKWFGVYQQKPNDGHFMLRLRLPGGQINPAQLAGIAKLCKKYARGFSDITTRQTFQFHWLTISDIKPIFQALASLDIDTQFACGDVPRNVVSCPLAGVIKNEIIDASNAVTKLADMYIAAGKQFSNLPRKFKTAIAGCPIHCHQPQINDIGLYGAISQKKEKGYGILVGGGLSRTPHFATPLGVFIKPQQVNPVSKALVEIFREYGYREKRTRARLKFLVADKGPDWILQKIEQKIKTKLLKDPSLQHPPAQHQDHIGTGQQQDGNYFLGIPIGRGRLSHKNMTDIANSAEKYAVNKKRIRLTNKQNILILDIPQKNLIHIQEQLAQAGLATKAHPLRDTLVSCTGSEFCNLAVVETKHRAGKVLDYLEKNTKLDRPLFISFTGCPNACAQFQIADIGLTGTIAKHPTKLNDKNKPLKVDAYNVLLGAGIGADPQFGEVIAKQIPATLIHLSIANIIDNYYKNRIDDQDAFQSWVSRTPPKTLQKLLQEPTQNPNAVELLA